MLKTLKCEGTGSQTKLRHIRHRLLTNHLVWMHPNSLKLCSVVSLILTLDKQIEIRVSEPKIFTSNHVRNLLVLRNSM